MNNLAPDVQTCLISELPEGSLFRFQDVNYCLVTFDDPVREALVRETVSGRQRSLYQYHMVKVLWVNR